MKNLTKKTMILGLMVAFLFPFSAIAQRGNTGGNQGTGGGNTYAKHKPKQYSYKNKPHYNYGHQPRHRQVHPTPRYRGQSNGYHQRHTYRRPVPSYNHRPSRNWNNRNYRPGMQVIVFNNLQTSLNRTYFDKERLDIAKIAILNNGATTSQVIRIMNNLSFDRNRLELAKFAFDYVADPNEYFRVVDNLDFYSNRNALLQYIQ